MMFNDTQARKSSGSTEKSSIIFFTCPRTEWQLNSPHKEQVVSFLESLSGSFRFLLEFIEEEEAGLDDIEEEAGLEDIVER
jgi:hypothetical protein